MEIGKDKTAMWNSDTEFDDLYDKGLTDLMKGELQSAENIFKQLLQSNPQSHIVRYQLGKCYLRLGKINEARKEFETALQLQPEHIPSLIDLAFLYLCQNLTPLAMNAFTKILELRPDHGKSLIGLAICHFSSGNWEIAHEWALKSIQSSGNHFLVLYILGKIEKVLGFEEKAEEHLKKAEELLQQTTEVAPEQPECYYLRAEIALTNAYYNKAHELYSEVEKRIDKNRDYYFYHEKFNYLTVLNKQGICMKMLGKKEETKAIAKKILELDPENKLGKQLLED